MDPTKMLEADHREAEELFSKIQKAEGQERLPLIEKLVTALRAHMQLEEDVLYPVMQPVTGAEAVEEANTEHELARKAMQDVVKLAPDEPGFGAALEALEAGIKHHVKEEEDEIFPELRSDGKNVLEQITTPFMKRRAELGMEMPAGALAASFTKDELVAEAESVGLEDAAGMNKEQLAEALADAMAG